MVIPAEHAAGRSGATRRSTPIGSRGPVTLRTFHGPLTRIELSASGTALAMALLPSAASPRHLCTLGKRYRALGRARTMLRRQRGREMPLRLHPARARWLLAASLRARDRAQPGRPPQAGVQRPRAGDPCFPPRPIRITRRWRPASSRYDHGIYANNTFTDDGHPARAGYRDARGVTFLDAAARRGSADSAVVCRRREHPWRRGCVSLRCSLAAGWRAAARNAHRSRLCGQRRAHSRAAGHARRRCRRRAVPTRQHGRRLTRVRSGFHRGEAWRTPRPTCSSGSLSIGCAEARWNDTIVAVVSDHGQITADLSLPPIDVPARTVARAGIEAEVIEEGSSALIRARGNRSHPESRQQLDGVAGRASVRAARALCACAAWTPEFCDAQAAHHAEFMGARRRPRRCAS